MTSYMEDRKMIRGIYNNSSAMQYLDEKLDVISNNLANTETNGFKRSGVAFRQHITAEQAKHRELNNLDPLPRGEIQTYIEYTPGALRQTGNPLNFALDGKGFFTVQTPEGIAWTRDGAFSMDDDGYIVTQDGYYVLGEYNGPIKIFGNSFSTSDNGDIVVDNQVVNRFLIQDFDLKEVVQRGQNLYHPRDPYLMHLQHNYLTIYDAQMKQGFLETSNVNIVKEMISMIAINRQYQANDKAIKTQDEALNKSVNNISR